MLPDGNQLLERMAGARQRAGLMLLGLDFDGTLAPIVPRPDDAALPPNIRPVLERLARRVDTRVALVSGRSLTDLRRRVDLPELFYAGNHGLEIDGPGVQRVHPEAQAAIGRLAEVAALLQRLVGGTPGVIVEDKSLTLSVHYRMVDDEAAGRRIAAAVEKACAPVGGLRLTHGKKVVEIRPDVDWDKGRALEFLRFTITRDVPNAPTVFIGDDRTDEDAFRVVGDDGFAIYVGNSPPPDTAAHAVLAGTQAVAEFLQRLAA
jgi:trehalose 6-phosphate phosphatase